MLIVAETVATTTLLKDSFITGHHVYKTIWTPFLTETLSVETEEDNQYDKYAVAVLKVRKIVGHVPRSMSKVSFFLNATVKQRCVFLGVAISNARLGTPIVYSR